MVGVVGDEGVNRVGGAERFEIDGGVVERVSVVVVGMPRVADFKGPEVGETEDASVVVNELRVHSAVTVPVQPEDFDVRHAPGICLKRLALSLSDDGELKVARVDVPVAEAIDVAGLGAAEAFFFEDDV